MTGEPISTRGRVVACEDWNAHAGHWHEHPARGPVYCTGHAFDYEPQPQVNFEELLQRVPPWPTAPTGGVLG